MKTRYPPKVQKAVRALLTTPAVCTPELRRAVEAYAARLSVSDGTSRGAQQAQDIPAELVPYVSKVVRYAYKVTDEDVQRLTAAGYSEDAIFEITLCASVGAGLARMERGLLALRGGRDAITDS